MKRLVTISLLIASLVLATACGGGAESKEIKSGKIGDLTATIANEDGVLRHGEEEFTLSFTDASGQPVDVKAASLNFYMPAMGTMPVMNDPASLTTTDKPGVFRGRAKIEMAGEWQAQISYEGPAGQGKGSFPVTAQ